MHGHGRFGVLSERLRQLPGKFLARRKTIVRILRQRLADHLRGARRNSRIHGVQERRLRRHDLEHQSRTGIGGERHFATEHLVGDHAQRELVRPSSHPGRHDLLRRHVGRGAEGEPGLGDGLGGDARDSKVGDLDLAVGTDQDVRRLHVAMHDPLAVGIVEGVGHLGNDRNRHLLVLRPTVGKRLFQRTAVDEFQDQVLSVAIVAELINGDDVRVGQLAGGRGLAGKSQLELGLLQGAGKLAGLDDLDRHQPADGGIKSTEHHTHGATAQLFQKLVWANCLHGDDFHILAKRLPQWTRTASLARRRA